MACSAGSVSPVCLGGGRANYFCLFPQTFSVFHLRALLDLFLLSPSLGVTSVPGASLVGDVLVGIRRASVRVHAGPALGMCPHLLLANCPCSSAAAMPWLKPGVLVLGMQESLLSSPREMLREETGLQNCCLKKKPQTKKPHKTNQNTKQKNPPKPQRKPGIVGRVKL